MIFFNGSSGLPEYLYHYTSIETLGLILSGRKIKFNRLDNVDDLSEAETKEGEHLSRNCFVSCWTDIKQENIPLWSMYTNMEGVRLKLKKEMFKLFFVEGVEGEKKRYSKGNLPLEISLPYCGPIDLNTMLHDQYILVPIFSEKYFLTEVIYTSNKDLLKPQTLKEKGEGVVFSYGKLGKYKSKEWAFQGEWRFVISAIPIKSYDGEADNPSMRDRIPLEEEDYIFGITELFLDLQDNAFNGAEITLGPKSSKGARDIVNLLVEKYAPEIRVLESSIRLKL